MRREVLELLSGGTVGGAAIDLPPIVPSFLGGAAGSSSSGSGAAQPQRPATSSTSISTSTTTNNKAAAASVTALEGGTNTAAPPSSYPSKRSTKWIWAPFASSARKDGALFYHWVKSHVEYPGI
jgi:hypothetical protein